MNFKERPLCGNMILDNIPIFLYSFDEHVYDLNNEKIIQNGISYTQGSNYSVLFLEKKVYNDE